jgi:3-oxoacyl-[acyl-carrier protein] reductase
MTKKLEGKVAVVTGASKGIGAGIAKALADEGAAVVVNYSSSQQGADRVVAEITGRGGRAIAVQGDVSKQAHIERLFSEAKKAFGRLDILVNNAGVYEFSPLEGVTEDFFHKQFELNVLGLLLTTKEGVKHMGPEGGSIINIGSGASSMRPANSAVYTATKAAVDAITGVLAKELGPRKIRVNSDQPGGDRDRGATRLRIGRKRLPEDGRGAGAARPRGAAGRYLADGGLSGVVRLEVHDGGDSAGGGRSEVAGAFPMASSARERRETRRRGSTS